MGHMKCDPKIYAQYLMDVEYERIHNKRPEENFFWECQGCRSVDVESEIEEESAGPSQPSQASLTDRTSRIELENRIDEKENAAPIEISEDNNSDASPTSVTLKKGRKRKASQHENQEKNKKRKNEERKSIKRSSKSPKKSGSTPTNRSITAFFSPSKK